MMAGIASGNRDTEAAFSLTLHVSDVKLATAFYRTLFDCEPVKSFQEYAEFVPPDSHLVVGLLKVKRFPGTPRNRIGIRWDRSEWQPLLQRLAFNDISVRVGGDSAELVDPDGNVLTLYTEANAIERIVFDENPRASTDRISWEHGLGSRLPSSIPHADGTVDEVFLQATLNAGHSPEETGKLLAEVHRVLKPGGRVTATGLVGNVAVRGPLNLPGLAGRMATLPQEAEPTEALEAAGFDDLFYELLGDIICYRIDGIDLRKFRLVGFKPTPACPG